MFGSSGIRGVIGKEISPIVGVEVGKACAMLYDDVIVGHDPRTTSIMLKNAVISGLLSCGASVTDAGMMPTPAIAYMAREHDAGVMITASHNPPPYNGIKIFERDGAGISMERAREIEELIGKAKYAEWYKYKDISFEDISDKYIDAILKETGETEGKIILDCSNGAASVITPYLLRKLGMEVVTLNCNPDGYFPGHLPEPVEENLHQLKALCSREKAFGIAHDCDADRMVVVNKDGRYVQNEKLMIIFANFINADKIITPVDTSMVVDDYFDGEVIRTRVGDIFVSEKLKQEGGFGAEVSGTWTFPSFSYGPDGIFAAAKFATMLKEIDFMEEIKKIPSYPVKRESFKGDKGKIESAMLKIEEEISKMNFIEVMDIDGYRIEFEDGWVLIRKSGTEPKIRLTVEAKEKEKLKELYEKFAAIVRRSLK